MGGTPEARHERAAPDFAPHETEALSLRVRPGNCPNRDAQTVAEFAMGGQLVAGPQPPANLRAKGRDNILDRLEPRAVVFCHWEDFFRPKTRPPREIVKVNLDKLREANPSTPERAIYFPSWGAVFEVEPPSPPAGR